MTEAPTTTIRVALADAHAMVRRGLALLLAEEPDLDVVADGDDVGAVRDAGPDVVVADAGVPGRLDHVPTVVLTADGSSAAAREAFRRGARGVVGKHAGDEELKQAVRAAALGETYLSPALGAQLAGAAAPADELSPRERDVLRMIGLGHTNGEVGDALNLSIRTVEAHRARILQKLGISTRAELVRAALERGLR